MKKVIQKHSLAIRWFHWINFPLLLIMIWSGILIYWANDVYRIGWGDTTILKFFPDTFYKALNIPFRLAEGMNLHFVFMWLFILNGILYVGYLLVSKEWRAVVPGKRALRESWQVLLHDLRIRKMMPTLNKYNAAQRIAYTGVILLGFLSIVTGFAIYKPVQLGWLCTILGGYEAARAEHFIITILFVLFILVHVLQVIMAGWKKFSSMITGIEITTTDKLKDYKL